MQKDMRAKFAAFLGKYEGQLEESKGPFLFGKEVSQIDFLIAPWILRLPVMVFYRDYGVPTKHKTFLAYCDALAAHPAIKSMAHGYQSNLALSTKNRQPQPPSFVLYGQHVALRNLEAKIAAILASNDPLTWKRHALHTVFPEFHSLFAIHGRMEDTVVFKELNDVKKSDVTGELANQHGPINTGLEALRHAFDADAEKLSPAFDEAFKAFSPEMMKHLAAEEAVMFPIFVDNPTVQVPIIGKALASLGPEDLFGSIGVTVKNLSPSEQHRYMEAVANVTESKPDQWKSIVEKVRSTIDQASWVLLNSRMHAVFPLSCQAHL